MEQTQVAPTKGNLMATKKSLELAELGWDLMDRKRNILVREMMALIDQADKLRDTIDETFRAAYAALQKANITGGVVESAALSAPVEQGLRITYRSVMGVELPTVHLDTTLELCYDFSSSNSAHDHAFLCFHQVKLLSAQLAEIENSVYKLAVGIKQTQSRANALKNIIIPNLQSTAKFIADALEEKEREEFTRLKVIKKSKHNAH